MPLRKQLLYQTKKLHYFAIGQGQPLVLLHGFGEDATIWKKQYNAFPNHQLIIPFLPGSGRSQAIGDMSMEGLAAAVKAIIDAEGATNIALLGHSMGGYVTLAFIDAYPQLVKAFGLVHSTAFADSSEKKETRKKGIEFIKTHGAASFLKTITPGLYAPGTNKQKPKLIEQHLAIAERFTNDALISYYEAMMNRPDRTSILKETNLPVLFLLGTHDTTVPLADGLQQLKMPQLSYIHILENSAHMGFIEEGKDANSHIAEFLQLFQR